jgi:D-glycero-alpha-D-manno-heptose 1-phosphate guanylyltransferase
MFIQKPISAVILASGSATRLKQECANTPKCLLEFNGIPFLNFLINWLLKAGVEKIVVTAYAHKQKIEKEIVKTWKNFDVKVASEDALISTVASAYIGLKLVDTEDALILTADTIWDLSLAEMIRFHQEKNANATISLTKRNFVPNLGKIKVISSGKVVSIWDNPVINLGKNQFVEASTIGVYIVNVLKILKTVDILKDSGIEKEPLARLLPEVWAYWCDGLFLDYGTPDRLNYLRRNSGLIEEYFGKYPENR